MENTSLVEKLEFEYFTPNEPDKFNRFARIKQDRLTPVPKFVGKKTPNTFIGYLEVEENYNKGETPKFDTLWINSILPSNGKYLKIINDNLPDIGQLISKCWMISLKKVSFRQSSMEARSNSSFYVEIFAPPSIPKPSSWTTFQDESLQAYKELRIFLNTGQYSFSDPFSPRFKYTLQFESYIDGNGISHERKELFKPSINKLIHFEATSLTTLYLYKPTELRNLSWTPRDNVRIRIFLKDNTTYYIYLNKKYRVESGCLIQEKTDNDSLIDNIMLSGAYDIQRYGLKLILRVGSDPSYKYYEFNPNEPVDPTVPKGPKVVEIEYQDGDTWYTWDDKNNPIPVKPLMQPQVSGGRRKSYRKRINKPRKTKIRRV